ncbi:MAG: hypothetical protein COT09_03440, partial [Candidatus Hydromicrobium americanum]
MVMRKLRRKMRVFLWFAMVIFVAGMTAMMVGGEGRRKLTPIEQGKIGEICIKPTSTWQKIKGLTHKKKIPLSYQSYSNLVENYKKQGFPPWESKDIAFNTLVESALVAQELQKREIGISYEEVVELIKNNPPPELQEDTFFQTNGEFDYNKYLAVISDPASIRWLSSYELIIRDRLPKEILYQTIASTIRPTTIDLVE